MTTPWWKILPLVISNFAFILPAVRALQYKRIFNAFIYLSVTTVSSLYHLCKVDSVNEPGEGGICFVLSFEQYHHLDFFFAQLILPITGMYFITFNAIVDKVTGKIIRMPFYWVEKLFLYIYAVIIALSIMVFEDQGDGRIFAALIISILTMVIVFWLQNYFQYNLKPSFDWIDLTIAIILSVISVVLISLQRFVTGDIYWITHSIWHVGGAVGQFYFLESRNTDHSGVNMFTPWIEDLKAPFNTQPTTIHRQGKMIPTILTTALQKEKIPSIMDYSSFPHNPGNIKDKDNIIYYDYYIDKDPWMIPGHSIWTLFQWALPPYVIH